MVKRVKLRKRLLVTILSMGGYDWFRLLAMFSGIIVVIVGVVFALKAPFIFTEFDIGGYGIRRYIGGIPMEFFPILPVCVIILGLLTFALALRGRRYLTLPTFLCLGLIITSLTFMYRNDFWPHYTADFGYPFSWLTWSTLFVPRIVGVIPPMFLIDLAFWSFVAWAVIFAVNHIKRILSRGYSLGGVSPPSPKGRAEREPKSKI